MEPNVLPPLRRADSGFGRRLFAAGTLAGMAGVLAVPVRPREVEAAALVAPPSRGSAPIIREGDGVSAAWASPRDVTLRPTDPRWRIAGTAGLELIGARPCLATLPDGYLHAVTLRAHDRDIDAVGLGLCDPADGACHWREVAR